MAAPMAPPGDILRPCWRCRQNSYFREYVCLNEDCKVPLPGTWRTRPEEGSQRPVPYCKVAATTIRFVTGCIGKNAFVSTGDLVLGAMQQLGHKHANPGLPIGNKQVALLRSCCSCLRCLGLSANEVLEKTRGLRFAAPNSWKQQGKLPTSQPRILPI